MNTSVTFGADYSPAATVFTVFAPSSEQVMLRLYDNGDPDAVPTAFETHMMYRHGEADGIFTVTLPGDRKNIYYDYLLTYRDGRVVPSADPWAKASGVNGHRSMVVDLAATDPDGWDTDRNPYTGSVSPVIWETHVKDFSFDEHCGVREAWRGKYLAFTEENTTLDGDGVTPTCLAYLKTLGVTHVQLQPIADYESVDERTDTDYNWGYDIGQYNVPEGSFSTDPYHGEVRIKECKQMIRALHRAGIGVVLDVVYNHTYQKHSSLDKTAPFAYYRHSEDGAFLNASGCGCETASEREPFRNFMIKSVLYWAAEYHVDGFRFDLMGIHDIETMNLIRASLDALPNGKNILMYGEPWSCLPTGIKAPAIPVSGDNMRLLSERIGIFCGDTRTSLTGDTFDPLRHGLAGGNLEPWHVRTVKRAAGGYCHPYHFPAMLLPTQCVQYASCHDNYTLFDRFVLQRGDTDFDRTDEEIVRRVRFVSGVYMTCLGLAFFQSGEEFCRTKHGCGNSYNGPAAVNRLDWRLCVTYAPLVEWYRGLIGLRRLFMPRLDADAVTETMFLDPPEEHCLLWMKYAAEGVYTRYLVCCNPLSSPISLILPHGKWCLLCDGEDSTLWRHPTQYGSRTYEVPPLGVVIFGKIEPFERAEERSAP